MPHARYSSNHQQNARTTSEWHEGLANIWISHCVQCESKKTPPHGIQKFFPNGWKFLFHFLRTYYTILSTLDYKFLFKYLQL